MLVFQKTSCIQIAHIAGRRREGKPILVLIPQITVLSLFIIVATSPITRVSQVHCIIYFFLFFLFVCLCLQYVESVFVWIKRKNENSKVLTLPPRKCQGVNIFHAMTQNLNCKSRNPIALVSCNKSKFGAFYVYFQPVSPNKIVGLPRLLANRCKKRSI